MKEKTNMIPSQQLKQFFPKVNIDWLQPLDNQVLVQVKFTQLSKLFKVNQGDRRAEQVASSVGKVVALGDAAYKKKDGSREPWPDYNVTIGEYIVVPKGIGSNYIWLKHPEISDEEVLFITMPDSNVKQKIINPIKAIRSLADLKLGA